VRITGHGWLAGRDLGDTRSKKQGAIRRARIDFLVDREKVVEYDIKS